MRSVLKPGLVGVLLCVFTLSVDQGVAQQVRYMDSAGNIHFVDNLSQVPPRYRAQIVPPTPTPVLDKRGQMEKKRAEAQAARERQIKENQRKAEERRKQREEEMAALREKKRLQRERSGSSFSRD